MNEKLKAMAWTLAKVFAAAAFAAYQTSDKTPDLIGGKDLQVFAWAGLSAVLVTAFNWFNPRDGRYGIGSNSDAA